MKKAQNMPYQSRTLGAEGQARQPLLLRQSQGGRTDREGPQSERSRGAQGGLLRAQPDHL